MILNGYGALTRGSPRLALARSLFLTVVALAAVAAITWVGLSPFLQAPEPIATGVPLAVGLGWLLVLYRTSMGFVDGFRSESA